jgi:Na+/melibiose symporter-like transporter
MSAKETYEFNFIMAMLMLSMYAIFLGCFCIKKVRELKYKDFADEESVQLVYFSTNAFECPMIIDLQESVHRF